MSQPTERLNAPQTHFDAQTMSRPVLIRETRQRAFKSLWVMSLAVSIKHRPTT